MSSDTTQLQKVKAEKKRVCRDEMQKRGTKQQVWRVRLSMGIGLAERSIRAHNLLEYMDR